MVIDPYEHPDNVEPDVAEIVEEAAPEYTDLTLQRRFRTIFAIGIVGLLLMGWLLVRAATSGSELDSLRKRNETLTTTNESQQLLIDKLATQLDEARKQGAAVPAPEVVAAETPGAEVSPVDGVQGERGDAGIPGSPGNPGEIGATGAIGTSGSKGDTGATGNTGSTGTPGVAGADGSPGVDGAPGSPGSPGVNGSDGTPGAPGADGAPGSPGAPGATGPQGPPPSSFTFTYLTITYTCTPTSPGASTFDCQP